MPMTFPCGGHIFDKSGLAAKSDLEAPEWKKLFSFLEKEQAQFLADEGRFRNPEYPWPRDPLHTWSRLWEYPYAYHHIERWRQANASPASARIADVGSGVTFFPFTVAKLGFEVACTDIDPVCAADLDRAAKVVSHAPGEVRFRQAQGTLMPFEDAELDAIYCVSVLEHIPRPAEIVRELARSLGPRGLLVVTMDIDLRGDAAIGPDSYRGLRELLDREFQLAEPEAFIHPLDILDSLSGPYSYPSPTPAALYWNELKQRVIKPLLGRKPGGTLRAPHLAVQGLVMTRRS